MLSFHAADKDGIEAGTDAKTIPSGASWIDALRPDAREIAFLERNAQNRSADIRNALRNRNAGCAARKTGSISAFP